MDSRIKLKIKIGSEPLKNIPNNQIQISKCGQNPSRKTKKTKYRTAKRTNQSRINLKKLMFNNDRIVRVTFKTK